MAGSEVSRKQDEWYQKAANAYGAALVRLAKAYEADPERRQDLLQDIHVALWRSFAGFNNLCSLRTWTYRIAHNVATSHIIHDARTSSITWLHLDTLEDLAAENNMEERTAHAWALERLMEMIQKLDPLERQIILLYLEGVEAVSISEITGLSPSNIATKIHRIKCLLIHRFHKGKPL